MYQRHAHDNLELTNTPDLLAIATGAEDIKDPTGLHATQTEEFKDRYARKARTPWPELRDSIKEIEDPVKREQRAFEEIRIKIAELILKRVPTYQQNSTARSIARELGVTISGPEIELIIGQVLRDTTTNIAPTPGGNTFEISETKWVLEDVLLSGLNLLSGMPGAGKSRLLAALAMAWVNGNPTFIGRKLHVPENPRVLLLGVDQGQADWADILEPLGLITEVKRRHPVAGKRKMRLDERIDLYPLGCGVVLDRDGFQLLSRWCSDNPGGLVIGDSMAALLPPGVKEADEGAGRWIRQVDEARLEIPVVLTHHVKKESITSGLSGVYASRGHSSIDGAVSRVLTLSYLQQRVNGGQTTLLTESNKRELVSQKRGAQNQALLLEMGPKGTWDYVSTMAEERELERVEREGTYSDRIRGWEKAVFDALDATEFRTVQQIAAHMSPEYQEKAAKNKNRQITRELEKMRDYANAAEQDKSTLGLTRWRKKDMG